MTSWRTSSYCGASNTCVQVAASSRDILVRDAAAPSAGLVRFRRDAFAALVRSVQASGRLDVQAGADEAPIPAGVWHMEHGDEAVPTCGLVLDAADALTRDPMDVTCPDCLLTGWDS